MDLPDVLRLLSAVGFAAAGIALIVQRKTLGDKPRRGTEVRMPSGGYLVLGLVFLVVGVGQVLTLLWE